MSMTVAVTMAVSMSMTVTSGRFSFSFILHLDGNVFDTKFFDGIGSFLQDWLRVMRGNNLSNEDVFSSAETPTVDFLNFGNVIQFLEFLLNGMDINSVWCSFHEDEDTIVKGCFACVANDDGENECASGIEVFGPWKFLNREPVDDGWGNDDANT